MVSLLRRRVVKESVFSTFVPNNIYAYPNPTSTNITIDNTAKGFLTINNLNGQQLLQQEITEPITTIDVSTLPSGVYMVKLIGEKGVQVGKFIKQ